MPLLLSAFSNVLPHVICQYLLWMNRCGPWLAEARHERAFRHWAQLRSPRCDTRDIQQRRAPFNAEQAQKRLKSGFKIIS
jgi:hypothetical protein